MAIECPKCHAGRASLYPRDVYLENGQHLQEIVCRICGEILACREVVTPKHTPATDVPEIGAARRIKQQAKSEKMQRIKRATFEELRAPCGIPGCPDTVVIVLSKYGICRRHSKQMTNWRYSNEQGISRTDPPYALVNGHWIERGQPLPAIPGRKPAPAVPKSSPPAEKRPSRHSSPWVGICEECGKRRPIKTWGTCFDCLENEPKEARS